MVFRKFFKNVKDTFNKLKNLSKKIRDERKELFKILTKLQNNLQKQKFIAEDLCKESTYRTILGNNLSEKFCELQGIIDSMLNLVYQERVRISKEIGLLDKVLKIYDEEKIKNINNPQVFNQIRSHEMAIAKALQSVYYSEVMDESILNRIYRLSIYKRKFIEKMEESKEEIKNHLINKKINELLSLTKEEEKLLSKIRREDLKEKKELKEEIVALNELEKSNVQIEQRIQHNINEWRNNLQKEEEESKTNAENLKIVLNNFLGNIDKILNSANELKNIINNNNIINKLKTSKKLAKTVGELSKDIDKLINDARNLRNNILELIKLVDKWLSSIIRWLNEPRNNPTNQDILRSAIENLRKIQQEIEEAKNILGNIDGYLREINNDIGKISNTIGEIINEISNRGIKDKLNEIVKKMNSSIDGIRNIIGNMRDLLGKIENNIEITINAINGMLSIIESFRGFFRNPNQGQTYTNIR